MLTESEMNVVRLPLVGRPSARVQLRAPVSVDHDVEVKLFSMASSTSPLWTKKSLDAQVIVTDGENEIYFELTPEEVAALNVSKLYSLRVNLIQDETDIVFSQSFWCYAINQYFSETFPMSALLSTRFVNTLPLLGESGGSGYLDGVVTVGQTVPCTVTYSPTGSQPETWVLEASTQATSAGAFRRPLDYSSENQKVWRKIQ